MNMARLTVMSLRSCTSRVTPRWSVYVGSVSCVLRYLSWVLMLNFSRNGTCASGGVSQMTMPSRYRSGFGVDATTAVDCAGGFGSVPGDCANDEVAKTIMDAAANASEALIEARDTVTSDLHPKPFRID